jgi:CheY-like chemotaxis protein
MEEELLKAQKLEAIGIIAGGIAHDFGNILTAATGKIFLAKARAKGDPELLEKLTGAEKAILQAKHLTRQLLTFSIGGAPIKRTASISELIQETADFTLSGSNVKSEFHIPHGLWAVEVDVGQISQVINNLIINALQAMPEGGELTVSAENVETSKHNRLPLKEGKYVRISVQDRGTGIPDEHRHKIFDPYFTTKPDGSGLGLATAYTIVNRHSGCITFESELGTGSLFDVYLPASGKNVSEKDRIPDEPITGSGRILLMDDDEEIRNTTGEVLRQLGYEVDFAQEGAEAIERFAIARASGHPYHAVILDLTVAGGIGGMDTMKRLLEIDPHVKALVSSGYSTDPITADYRNYGFCGALTKPYKAEELSQQLHRIMSETRD